MTGAKIFKTNFVLIDYENVQPKNLSILSETHFHTYLFLGSKQDRLNIDLVEAMHEFGPNRSKYIKVTQTAPNALDFHLTYYLGELVAKNPTAYFHIISKDKGFDPLVEHLVEKGVYINRLSAIADIPLLKINQNSNINEKFAAVVENLKGRGNSKPRKEETLKNTLRQTFKADLTESDVLAVFKKLKTKKYIAINNGKISYALPKTN